MKIAPIIAEIKKHSNIKYKLIHTGQHFDKNMSDDFFEELWLPYPDINFNIHGWSVAEQIGKVMIECNTLFRQDRPDYLLVVWDVNATTAWAIAAKQNWIRVIHVEAWLRSFDRNMPEEINRILTDTISDFLFVTEESGIVNLSNEGISNWVYFVGNVMIDCLKSNLDSIVSRKAYTTFGLESKKYGVVTLHRPSNVDTQESLERYLKFFSEVSDKIPLILPLHPRTKKNIEQFNLWKHLVKNNIIITEPLNYTDFMSLVVGSVVVLTDSGWVQEETTYLQVPCLTMRNSTERPVTCDIWSNTLVGDDFEMIKYCIDTILWWVYKKWFIPQLWDGDSASRIVVKILEDYKICWWK